MCVEGGGGLLLFENANFILGVLSFFDHYFSGIHLVNCMVFVFSLLISYAMLLVSFQYCLRLSLSATRYCS